MPVVTRLSTIILYFTTREIELYYVHVIVYVRRLFYEHFWIAMKTRRKRKKGEEGKQELFDEMVKLYSQLKTMKLSVIETKDQER